MPVSLPSSVVGRYERFSRYNSPYPAHDGGRAVDLYPADETAVSPVAGVVRETRTVGCPSRAYAASTDHLIVVDLADEWCLTAGVAAGTVARVLHVDPAVSAGDRIAVGDTLGRLTRSGFFGRWVANHLHLGFRPPGADAVRASGSLTVAVDADVAGVAWDGTGTVVETGPTHVVVGGPDHPEPGDRFAALASDEGVPLDGGLCHYAGGGTFREEPVPAAVSLWGTRVGTRTEQGLEWEPVDVVVDGARVVGLSLFAGIDDFGVKVVCPDHDLVVGDRVTVGTEPSTDPIRLGRDDRV